MSSNLFGDDYAYYTDEYAATGSTQLSNDHIYSNVDDSTFSDQYENAYVEAPIDPRYSMDTDRDERPHGVKSSHPKERERKTSNTQTTLSRGIVLSVYDDDLHSVPNVSYSPSRTHTSGQPPSIQQMDSFEESQGAVSRYFNHLTTSRRRRRMSRPAETFVDKDPTNESYFSMCTWNHQFKKVASIIAGVFTLAAVISVSTYFIWKALGKLWRIYFFEIIH